MTGTSSNTTWPKGMLRAGESAESIVAKLAIFNCVGALSYEPEVRKREAPALARLLSEHLFRVRSATSRPAWVAGMSALIERSTVVSESEEVAKDLALRRKYCSLCLQSFYHSWIHDLTWLGHCFVHRRTQLMVSPRAYEVPESHTLVKHLYAAWKPELESYIRLPETATPTLAHLSNRRVLHAVKALGTLFEPSPSKAAAPGAFVGHPVALNAWWEAIEQRDGVASVPWEHSENVSGADEQADEPVHGAAAGAPGAPAKNAPLKEDTPLQAQETTAPIYARAQVGIISRARAITRVGLACGVVSAIRQTTDNWLTRHHDDHKHLRHVGDVRFAAHSKSPKFWSQLSHVLAIGTLGPEWALLEDWIARMSLGHEECLHALLKCYDRNDHLAFGPDGFEDTRHVAYHLRGHGVCARLLTLDLVTRMLRPQFLCQGRESDGGGPRAARRQHDWKHAGLRTQGLLESHEWLAYGSAHKSTMVFPHCSEVEHFAHTLRALEWAFWRRESRGHGAQRIRPVLGEIVRDQQLVVVAAKATDENFRGSESLYTYFSTTGNMAPNWRELAEKDPSHAERTCRVLEDIRVSDLSPAWIDLMS